MIKDVCVRFQCLTLTETAAAAFPETTRKSVEHVVVRFLKNAADRDGGRQKRRASKEQIAANAKRPRPSFEDSE